MLDQINAVRRLLRPHQLKVKLTQLRGVRADPATQSPQHHAAVWGSLVGVVSWMDPAGHVPGGRRCCCAMPQPLFSCQYARLSPPYHYSCCLPSFPSRYRLLNYYAVITVIRAVEPKAARDPPASAPKSSHFTHSANDGGMPRSVPLQSQGIPSSVAVSPFPEAIQLWLFAR